jgi:gluconolactonase
MARTIITNLVPLVILWFMTCNGYGQSPVIADGAELVKAGTGYAFTEGPATDQDGNVYFTDQPNDKIYKWSAEDGAVELFMEGGKRSNGLYFDNEGVLLSCADFRNQIIKIHPDKTMEVVINDLDGKYFNGPNDLWVHPDGRIYFTDPFYKRDWWDHDEKEIEKENVYCFFPETNEIAVVDDNLVRPNGIVGSPDGKKLYVADINDKKTYSYKINKDGSLSKRKLFTEVGSDGMTLDNKGNVYVTNTAGVTVFNPKGEQIEQIPTGERWTANVVFGGSDQQTLFITAMGSVYTLDMKVRGVR